MAVKRMNTYIATVQFYTVGGKELNRRKIAENGLTSKSAKNKIEAHYRNRGDRIKVISIIRK